MSEPILFEVYPGLAKGFPYLSMAELPTPVAHYPALKKNLWVKHDDATSSLYGGNKVRKLEFILPQVKKAGKNHIVTFGGTGTNHGLATAIFCRKLGMQCTVLLFDQPDSEIATSNYRALKNTGANLIHCGSVLRTALSFYSVQRLRNPRAYFLFAGGSNVEGCLAFVNAAFELKRQYDAEQRPYPNLIFCATGSCATSAGLMLGCHLAGLPTKVVGVRVADSHLGPIPTCTTGTITALIKKTLARMRSYQHDMAYELPPVKLLDGYFGNGYGEATEAGVVATNLFAQEGISLEQTYTAKAAAAALDCCARHPQQTVLYWHTFNSAETG